MSLFEFFKAVVDFMSIDISVMGVTFSYMDLFAWIMLVSALLFFVRAVFVGGD